MNRARALVLAGVSTLVVLAVVAGCSLGGGSDPGPGPTGRSSSSGGSTGESTPEGPTTQDLADQLFDVAEASAEVEPIATGSGVGPESDGEELTIEVLDVTRTQTSTVVQMRWTGPEGANFNDRSWRGARKQYRSELAGTLYLVDPAVTASRYLPLSFDQVQQSTGTQCACPNASMNVYGDGILVSASYPALPPEVSAVDLVANDGWLTVPGIPLED